MEEKIKVEVDSGKEFEAFIDREYKDGLNKTSTPLEIESPEMKIFAENQGSPDNPENFVKVVLKDEFTKENAGEMIEKVKDIFQEYNLAYEKNVLVLDSEVQTALPRISALENLLKQSCLAEECNYI